MCALLIPFTCKSKRKKHLSFSFFFFCFLNLCIKFIVSYSCFFFLGVFKSRIKADYLASQPESNIKNKTLFEQCFILTRNHNGGKYKQMLFIKKWIIDKNKMFEKKSTRAYSVDREQVEKENENQSIIIDYYLNLFTQFFFFSYSLNTATQKLLNHRLLCLLFLFFFLILFTHISFCSL